MRSIQNGILLLFLIPVGTACVQCFDQALSEPGSVCKLFFGVVLVGLFAVGLWSKLAAEAHRKPLLKLDGFIVHNLIAVGGAAASYWLNIHLGLGPLIASGLVGVPAGHILKPEQAKLAYAAVFVGMTAGDAGWLTVLMASILLCAIYTLTSEWCVGVGGRLGTLAACSVIIAVLVFG